jgi:hypothetical protein
MYAHQMQPIMQRLRNFGEYYHNDTLANAAAALSYRMESMKVPVKLKDFEPVEIDLIRFVSKWLTDNPDFASVRVQATHKQPMDSLLRG